MADRYWVGGSGIWGAGNTAKWSATSGGGGGASVPTSADNVFFDTLSGFAEGGLAQCTGAASCLNFTYTPNISLGFVGITVDTSLTIAGTLSTSGTAGNNRLFFRALTTGIATNLVITTLGSISDIDFRDVYVTGTAAPLTGTRLGNVANSRGVTFSAPKTVYWNLAGTQNWSSNGWAATSGGIPSTNNFPLVQDTAVFDNTGSVTGTITMDTLYPYYGTVDMSARTTAMTLVPGAAQVYGDWKNGSGTTISGADVILFLSRTTQTITSAGKTWSTPITVNTFGGTVALGDALNTGTNIITITSGNFVTNGYAVTAPSITSNSAVPRSISLGASTVTLSNTTAAFLFTAGGGLTFNAGTSTVNLPAGTTAFAGLGFTYYDINVASGTSTIAITNGNTFHNFTVAGLRTVTVGNVQTFTGSLVYVGAPTTRLTFTSDTIGTPRTVVMNGAFSSTNIDFRDIAVTGTAAPISGSTLGDLGGNSGITFTAKTVYWNLAGAQNWTATGWALTSGGTPNAANFPLPQDIAVFDNTGSVTGTIAVVAGYGYPTIDMSARTSAMTLNMAAPISIYGNWTNGSGTTLAGGNVLSFVNRSVTQTITSAGKTFLAAITINSLTGTTQLADALNVNGAVLLFTTGTFSAGANNVTSQIIQSTGVSACTVNMGSGTWTTSAAGTAWNFATVANLTLNQQTADILLSNTSASSRTFAGGGLSYNKLTIGGATGTSTTTFSGANIFTELASTKTVAHTVALSTSRQIFGKWTITGTAGNLVTVNGAGGHVVAGSRVSGINYLTMGTTSFAATSPGEFYAGVNSTGTGVGVILTAAPAAVTRYWVGGTGTWGTTTTNWSATTGGAGGASVPTSVDSVIFDTLSNATAYTVTCTATVLRCADLTMGAPLTGAVTWAGTAPIILMGNFALTGGTAGITRTQTGNLTLSGSTTGYTFNTNGVALNAALSINGVGCGWSLAGAVDTGTGPLTVSRGAFDTAGYSVTTPSITSNGLDTRSLSLGASTVTVSAATPLIFTSQGLTFNAGTSTFSLTATTPAFNGVGLTYYNVTYTVANTTALSITGANTFNNLTFTGGTTGIKPITFVADQTFTGALTSASTTAISRITVKSDVTGTTRTFTANNAASISDIDFQDITVVGTAAPISGTRIGDLGGNSGITTSTPKTVYWNLAGGQNWSSTGWAASSGGTPAVNNFPLPQDTAVFNDAGAIGGMNTDFNWAFPTVDMSARTTAMTFAIGTAITVYGDWIFGSGITISGTTALTFGKRGTQTITSAGKSFTQPITINSLIGTTQLADALVCTSTSGITFTSGAFDAVSYNVTSPTFTNSGTSTKTVSIGSGTWSATTAGSTWNFGTITGLTFNKGTGGILLSDTSTTARTFAGGGLAYPKLTIGGATGSSTTTITGNNTFAEISSIKTVAATIALGATIQTVGAWTASGTASNLLSVTGTSVTTPAYLVLTGTASADYLNIVNVRATPLVASWYAGTHSLNGGSLGWYFTAPSVTGRTGTFASTEVGVDGLAASGTILVKGTLSSIEVPDSFSSLGKVIVKGSLASTETGTDSFTASGSVPTSITGSLAASEVGSDSFSSTAKIIVTGALSAIEANVDGFTSTGKLPSTGVFNAVETGLDTFLSKSGISGAMSANEGGELGYVLKYFNGSSWQILYKDPVIY